MSPTIFWLGVSAWNWRPIRSGAGAALESCRGSLGVLPGQATAAGAPGVTGDAVFAHDPGDALAVDQMVPPAQFGGHPRHSVGAFDTRWIT